MDDTNEALKIWDALKPMVDREIKEKTASCIRSKKMTVTSAPNGTTIGVCEPFDTVTYRIPYSSAVSGAKVGDAVWVQWYFDNASTMIAMSFGDGDIGFVAKTGDTMTGQLGIKYSDIDINTHPTSNISHGAINLIDANGTILGGVLQNQYTNGRIGTSVGATRSVNGSAVSNYLHLRIADDGTQTVAFSAPSAWKDALGLDNAAFVNKTISGSNGTAAYTFTNNCAFIIFISGSAAGLRSTIYGYCTAGGSISVSQTNATSSTSISTTTATNKLTIKNAGSNACYATLMRLTGTAPT